MKIVPSADIGDLGPVESTAVIYEWKWYYSAPTLGLWVLLLLSIVLVKANRNSRALLILVPLLIVNLLWLIFKKIIGLASSQVEIFNMLFYSLTVGIAVLSLLAHKIGNRSRFITFILAFAVMAVAGLTGAISYGGLEFSQETAGALILLAILTLAMLLGFILTSWRCQKRCSGLRFMLYLALWIVAVCLASTLVIYSIVFIFERANISISTLLFMALMVSLVLGTFLYVLLFPYIILAFCSSFFRERCFACLRLRSIPTATGRETDDD